MSIDNNELASSLIAFYKSRGIDMSFLMGDPLFQSLKPPEKIEFIKTHSKTLAEGIHAGWTKRDVLNVLYGAYPGLLTTALSGVLSRAPGISLKAAAIPIAPLLIAGGTLAVGLQASHVKDQINARAALKASLENAAKMNTSESAAGVLSTQYLGGMSQAVSAKNEVLGEVNKKMLEGVSNKHTEFSKQWQDYFDSAIPAPVVSNPSAS